MFKLYFDTENDSFDGNKAMEIGRVIKMVVDLIHRGYKESNIYDLNGNKIGKFEMLEYKF